jgi:energy-coupling factor transporter ATP-binding protein EcfA2
MTLDLQKFYQATLPHRTLFVENSEEDQQYYIDFSSVRGGQIIDELKSTIALLSLETPTCQLFTGHVGCGKSTELQRLRKELEAEKLHVVYVDSLDHLELDDVDVSDILLVIARHVSESLAQLKLEESSDIKTTLKKVGKLLQKEIEFVEGTVPGVGKYTYDNGKVSVDFGIPGIGQVTVDSEAGVSLVAPLIGKITAKAKDSQGLRNKLRDYLEPQTQGIIEAINSELLEPSQDKLEANRKKGLVVIFDNLEKISNTNKPAQQNQQKHLFVERGQQLRQLNCHVIYTMPLGLRFSNDFRRITENFLVQPQVLPMVSVKLRNDKECSEGMELLQQMVLARAFPNLDEQERLNRITEIFDSPETLKRLCQISGGHVRTLLRLLNDSLKKQIGLPISRDSLEAVIQKYRNNTVLCIDDQEWKLLRKVTQTKKVAGSEAYNILVGGGFVYEYHDQEGPWFDINPILADAKELQ